MKDQRELNAIIDCCEFVLINLFAMYPRMKEDFKWSFEEPSQKGYDTEGGSNALANSAGLPSDGNPFN